MKSHTYTVKTAKRAGYPHRKYGYVVEINPPIVSISTGSDIEGIGFVPHWGGPRKTVQKFFGWYKHKEMAVKRAEELNK